MMLLISKNLKGHMIKPAMMHLEALKVLFFIVTHYNHVILGLEDVTPSTVGIQNEGISYINNFYMMLLLCYVALRSIQGMYFIEFVHYKRIQQLIISTLHFKYIQ